MPNLAFGSALNLTLFASSKAMLRLAALVSGATWHFCSCLFILGGSMGKWSVGHSCNPQLHQKDGPEACRRKNPMRSKKQHCSIPLLLVLKNCNTLTHIIYCIYIYIDVFNTQGWMPRFAFFLDIAVLPLCPLSTRWLANAALLVAFSCLFDF